MKYETGDKREMSGALKMEHQERKKTTDIEIRCGALSGALSLMIALLYWRIALNASDEAFYGIAKLGNIKCFAVFVVLFFMVFCLLYFVLRRLRFMQMFTKSSYLGVFVAMLGVSGIFMLLRPFSKDLWAFPTWITISVGILFALFVVLGVSLDEKGSFIAVAALILVFAVFWGAAVASVNTINTFYDMHHSTAYMDSIYNVYHHEAFQGGLTDQYGHYALFFYLPMKMFGMTSQSIAIILGILSAVIFILAMSAFCMVVSSNTIRVITIFVAGISGIVSRLAGIYWQCYPHRLLFPVITIFLAVYFSSRKIKIWQYVLGCFVMMLAVLWNFESGIICCLAWVAFTVIYAFQNYMISAKVILGCAGVSLAVIALSVFGALGISNLYNVSVGAAAMTFKEFVGMVIDDSYMDWLREGGDLLFGNQFYLHKIVVFFVVMCWGLLHNRLFGINKCKQKAMFCIMVSVMGIGLVTYYINRPLAGDKMVDLFFLLALGILISGVQKLALNWKQNGRQFTVITGVKTVFAVYAALVLAGYIMGNSNVYADFANRYQLGVYNYAELESFASEVGDVVPEDTWADGEGVTAIYMELGRDKKTRRFNDVTTETISEQPRVFLYRNYYELVPANYRLVKEFTYKGLLYGYFVRNDTESK